MEDHLNRNSRERGNIAHMTILTSYSIFSAILIVESLVLHWESWALPLIALAVICSWLMHIRHQFTEKGRLSLYSAMMAATFFFYGVHETSIYDLAPVTCVILLFFSLAGEVSLIYLIMGTYYVTMIYHLIYIASTRGIAFSALGFTRTLLHLVLVFMAGWVIRYSMDKDEKEKNNYNRVIATLEDTNRRTEDFLTNVSHELRTPINVVTGITSLIVNKEQDPELRSEVLSVQKAGFRLFEQIGDILDYTEIDTKRLTVAAEPYMLSSVIGDLVAEYRNMRSGEKKELVFDVDPTLPAVLVGDSTKLKKILRHLIGNSEKFTKQGGIYVRIYPLSKPYGINLCLEVEDTGIGMNASEISRIKEKFYQSNSSRSRRAGGLGLGLSIVYGLVTAMDGFLQIDSEQGVGTRVRISIPQKVSDPVACVTLENRSEMCIACFLRPEKYEVPQVREYYSRAIMNMVNGLGVTLHKVSEQQDLMKLAEVYNLTHIFTGREEYEADPDFFETMALQSRVIVAADPDFRLIAESRARILPKPLNCFFVASVIEGRDEIEKAGLRLVCPGIRALVVDDESMNLVVAQGVFRNYGMTVDTAGGGIEALRLAAEENYDIIFLDHMMPEMDGVEVMKKLRSMEAELARRFTIVALTANAVSGAREMFLREGFDEFLAKPMEKPELERVLKKVLPKSAIDFIPEDQDFADMSENGGKILTVVQGAGGGTDIRTMKAVFREKGIDVTAGIMYGGGDEEFYVELLNKFAADAPAKQEDLETAMHSGDIHAYQIRVHALKSTAKMIGAGDLSEAARKLEDAAKRNDTAYLGMRGEALMTQYREVVAAIRELLGEGEDLEVAEAVEIDEATLTEKLKELRDKLSTFEADAAEKLIDELGGCSFKGEALSGKLTEARRLVDDFDMSGAEKAVSALQEELL